MEEWLDIVYTVSAADVRTRRILPAPRSPPLC